jgi:Ca2+-binding EF-hand superfamily protein
MDIDKNGKISKNEAKGPLSDQFTNIEKNSEGFLTLDELTNLPKRIGSRPPRQAEV